MSRAPFTASTTRRARSGLSKRSEAPGGEDPVGATRGVRRAGYMMCRHVKQHAARFIPKARLERGLRGFGPAQDAPRACRRPSRRAPKVPELPASRFEA